MSRDDTKVYETVIGVTGAFSSPVLMMATHGQRYSLFAWVGVAVAVDGRVNDTHTQAINEHIWKSTEF